MDKQEKHQLFSIENRPYLGLRVKSFTPKLWEVPTINQVPTFSTDSNEKLKYSVTHTKKINKTYEEKHLVIIFLDKLLYFSIDMGFQ